MDWNINIFTKINSLVGRNKWFDAFGRAGGEIIIVFSVAWFLISTFLKFYPEKIAIFMPIAFLGLFWFLGLGINQLIGLLVKEPRPQVMNREIKLLFEPISKKSFPSDHALAAFLIFFMALIFELPFLGVLLVFALWICWGRIYCGVHYPLDIVGGFLMAGLMGVVAWYIYLLVF